ncbi:ubiquinol-cytochrome c reductase iron-sulfur subunit [Nocardia sp. NPDC059177]|uniref:QcrA and Rieske domain-containing protein n=1 Tax=Nocardia sp. NPDC059177 TaxID=3346759 RepID=UPI0036BA7C41
MDGNELAVDRRTLFAGVAVLAGAVTLPACAERDAPAPAAAEPAPDGALTTIAAVPVGGGVVAGDTVVTQPAAGTFVGLSSTCTHAGCRVTTVANGTINCPCHGSRFTLDGAVHNGPARDPLPPRPVRVDNNAIYPA